MLHRRQVQAAILPVLEEVLAHERLLYLNHLLDLLRLVDVFVELYVLL